jgi:ATP-dependent exoDNAse (exonuclease V) beta subunit
LDFARNVIVKAVHRLETRDKNIRKDIKSANDNLKNIPTEVKVQKFESEVLEYKFIAEELQKLVKTVDPKEIAIICRKHDELKNLANVLNTYQIPYSYEKRENVLDKQHIHEILQILKYLHLENQGSGEELLPEILSYKFWGIERLEIWKIAEVVKNGLIHKDENEIKIWKSISWMEAMQKSSNHKIQNIATFLIDLSVKSKSTPLEVLIDEIIGTREYLFEDSEHDDSIYSDTKNGNSREFISPYKEFYFNKKVFDHNKPQYLDFLLSLRTFIVSLREFHKGTEGDFKQEA